MRRFALLGVTALLAALLGMAALLWFQDPARRTAAPAPATREVAARETAPIEPGTSATSEPPTTRPDAAGSVLLTWTAGGIPAGLGDAARRLPGVEAVTEVSGDVIELVASSDADGAVVDRLSEGWAIPLDALAVDPPSYAPFVAADLAATFTGLGPDDAVLGETSAALRRLGAGSTIELSDARRLRVAAVVPDEVVGAAEVVVRVRPAGPVTTPRYLLVLYTGPRPAIEAALRAALPEPRAIRFRSPAETPFLRHGDAVLPQAFVKTIFGEFSYRRLGDNRLELDGDWTRRNLVTDDLPIVGRTTCHRAVMPALREALAGLEDEGLAWLLPTEDYGGCFSARMASNGDTVSRHAWGVAVDLNSGRFPLGFAGDQDPRLLGAMLDHSFASGAGWLVPDPAHFEWVLPPSRESP